MSPAAAFFWTLGGVNVLLSMRIQIRAARIQTPNTLRQAKGQKKDDWLGTAVMLLVIISDETALTGWLYLQIKEAIHAAVGTTPNVAGTVYLLATITMAWLLKRTMQRLQLPPNQW